MKGNMVGQFHVGQAVEFQTSIRHDIRPGGQKTMTTFWERGTITKLHRSGSTGSAIIRGGNGKRVTRRLLNVKTTAQR